MIMSIFEALLLFSLGWLIGVKFVLKFMKVEGLFDEKNETTLTKSNTQLLIVEIHNSIFYIFNEQTNSFVCQGKTLEETIDLLPERGVNNAILCCGDRKILIKDGVPMGVLQ